MKSKKGNLEFLFTKQNRRTKKRIRNMENSTSNIYSMHNDRNEYIAGIEHQGVLHGWKF